MNKGFNIDREHICKYLFVAFLIGVFVAMFSFNYLTTMRSDDFTYVHSFQSGEQITSVFQIFPSMIGHAKGLNGRIFAHFFVQLFVFLPPICFDFVNAGIFVCLIIVINCYLNTFNCTFFQKLLLGIGSFAAIWVFPLDFGEVFLWLAGSCNYLWGILFGLLFLLPYFKKYELAENDTEHSFIVKCLFVIFAFFVGGWSENISSTVIFASVVFLIIDKVFNRTRTEKYLVLAVFTALIGFCIMALAPAELKGKISEFSMELLIRHFRQAMNMYKEYATLVFLYVFLFICSVFDKANKKLIVSSIVFFCCSLTSNFILSFAQYYSGRSSGCVAIFLIIANEILLVYCCEKRRIIFYTCISFIAISFLYWFVIGTIDIANVYIQTKSNEQYIYSCKREGILDIKIPMVRTHTKYSNNYTIDTGDSTVWPNNVISEYYGLNSIVGYEEDVQDE